MSELTDEQVKWLGEFMYPGEDFSGYTGDYFRIAEGREAVMDRAVEKGYRRFDFNSGDGTSSACYVRKHGEPEIPGKGPTRFLALVNALMEAEGK